jgi:hypothetical protein
MIRFMPLDVPKFEHKSKVLKEFKPDTEFYFWSEEYISEWNVDEPLHSPAKLKPVHTELVDYIYTYLPFESITLLKLLRANKDVKAHVDDSYTSFKGPKDNCRVISEEYRQHQLATEPCGYRIIIEGDRKSLYLTDGTPDVIDGELRYKEITKKKYCHIPETTDSFVLQSYGSMHGVDKTPGDDNRLLAFIIGWIDLDKHQELIKRSEEVYKDYVHYA